MNTQVLKTQSVLFIFLSILMVTFGTQSISYAQEGTPGVFLDGPWLWMVVPTGAEGEENALSPEIDSLALASGGALTEADIAQNGANAGDIVGETQWIAGVLTPTKLASKEYCGISFKFLFPSFECHTEYWQNNLNETVKHLGFGTGDDLIGQTAYALIHILSPQNQSGIMYMKSGDAQKVWFNGEVVHRQLATHLGRRDISIFAGFDASTSKPDPRGFETQTHAFPVRLKAGKNLLLVKVRQDGEYWDMRVALDADFITPPSTDQVPSLAILPEALSEPMLDGSVIRLYLTEQTFVPELSKIREAVSVSGLTGVTIEPNSLQRISDTEVAFQLDHDFTDADTDAILTFSVGAGAIVTDADTPLTAEIFVDGIEEAVSVSSENVLTERTLDGSGITLTLMGRIFEPDIAKILEAVSISGIPGISIKPGSIERVSDTEVAFQLAYDNNDFDSDTPLTFSVSDAAIVNYGGDALRSKTDDVEAVIESVSAWSPAALQEATLDGSDITLTLKHVTFEPDVSKILEAVSISGIPGVTLNAESLQRLNTGQIKFSVDFDGTSFTTARVLTVSVSAAALVNYKGDALTAEDIWVAPARSGEVLVYWAVPLLGKIQRVNLDGSNVETLVEYNVTVNYPDFREGYEDHSRRAGPEALALDVTDGKMYWIDRLASKIQRVNLDGSNVETLIDGVFDTESDLFRYPSIPVDLYRSPTGIALDVAGNKIYWIETGLGHRPPSIIRSANLDGSNVKSLIYGTLKGMALDVAGGKIYWMDAWDDIIQRANLDGSNIETLIDGVKIDSDSFKPACIAVAGGKMYYSYEGRFQCANLDGSNIKTFTDGGAKSITSDVVGGKLYWTTGRHIKRANLDGSNVETLIEDTGTVTGIAVAITPEVTPLTPDLVVEAVQAVPTTVESGETFRLYTTLKNQESGVSTATKLWYYQSTDAVISTEDVRLGSVDIDPLAANDTIRFYINRIAPTPPGTYYFGVCVDSVHNESNTENNCSIAVSITVTVPSMMSVDVNGDGTVDVADLAFVAERYGQTGENPADVNGDEVVNIDDLILVAAAIDAAAAVAPSLSAEVLEELTVRDVRLWLSEARQRDLTDPSVRKGILFLEQLLAVLTPKETALLANYPNPFNPETWIPYDLSEPMDVTLTIYAVNGEVIRRLSLGHQRAGIYQSRSRAAYWDGRNSVGEPVASGVYFYTLKAGDFSATRKMLIQK